MGQTNQKLSLNPLSLSFLIFCDFLELLPPKSHSFVLRTILKCLRRELPCCCWPAQGWARQGGEGFWQWVHASLNRQMATNTSWWCQRKAFNLRLNIDNGEPNCFFSILRWSSCAVTVTVGATSATFVGPTTINSDEQQSTMINNNQQWSTMINNDQQWSMMINNDKQWSTVINNDQQWSMMINNDQQWSTMINDDQQWSTMINNG